ncbi:hypothetical protein [Clostridium hydrogenum]|uniref:hypothetical protein n=1 Tax=Clostridium hydrogenum TaxID=2855764 RepID=UPI002E3486D8|nr:hypothetical protein [Clostridium hydrogenum]
MNLCYMVKSFSYLTLLKAFVNSNINIKEIKSIQELEKDDLFLISKQYDNYNEVSKELDNVIIWEDILNKFYNYAIEKYFYNYDYYYLKNSLKSALKDNIETIFVGSSYARFGVEESLIKSPCVNLSLPSQDIYYSCLIGRYIVSKNSNIKRVFIGTGYYSFYSDLSLTKEPELMRIADVYYPIFKDLHNCKELSKSVNLNLYEDKIFNIKIIVDFLCEDIFKKFNGEYFIEGRNRVKLRYELEKMKDCKWSEIDDISKEDCARERTAFHNKAIKYVTSYKENIEILNSFVNYCNEKSIAVYMIVFPSTKFYKKYLLKQYRESYISALNSIDGIIHLVDFNDINVFNDTDFVDTDHLDKSGAIKVCEIINNLNMHLE